MAGAHAEQRLRGSGQASDIRDGYGWHQPCVRWTAVADEIEAIMRFKVTSIYLFMAVSAACGGDDDGGAQSAEIDACAIVTQEDATGLFGQPASPDEGALVTDPALLGECLWTWEAADASSDLLAIYVWDDQNGLYYTEAEGAEPFDIGEEGYILVDDTTGIDIGWKQDAKAIYLDFFTIGPMVPAATTRVDAVKAIAQQAEARL